MSTNYEFIQNLATLTPEIPKDSIISRTFHEDERLKVIIFGFAEGQELSEHTASQPAMLMFLEGEAELTLGDEVHEAHSGTWVHMPARLTHGVKAKTQMLMLLVLYKAIP
jgi:quercetin dioxygenase-like cupin family protein